MSEIEISGIASEDYTGGASFKPFANLTIADPNVDSGETIAIKLTGPGQLTMGDRSYDDIGTDQYINDVRNFVFYPEPNSTSTISLTAISGDTYHGTYSTQTVVEQIQTPSAGEMFGNDALKLASDLREQEALSSGQIITRNQSVVRLMKTAVYALVQGSKNSVDPGDVIENAAQFLPTGPGIGKRALAFLAGFVSGYEESVTQGLPRAQVPSNNLQQANEIYGGGVLINSATKAAADVGYDFGFHAPSIILPWGMSISSPSPFNGNQRL